jgi:P27 family predicted phage terminase small subunit
MTPGRRPKPTAIRRRDGNPGKRGFNRAEPVPPDAAPRCPGHLSPVAQKEWRRLANALHKMGVLTVVDRAALAAYCQAYGRWVEAEEKLRETPVLFKTPSGYVQQSPWLGIANKQLELMGRYMVELGLTPASRSRVATGMEALLTIGPASTADTLADAEAFLDKMKRLALQTASPDCDTDSAAAR